MALKLGRVGLDIPLREPHSWAQTGSEVSLTGLLTDVASWELRAQREQLLGLGEDEKIILVRSDSVPELDGFYQVGKVDVGAPPGSFAYRSQPWAAQLTRIGNQRQPFVETYALAAQVSHGWGAGLPTPLAYHFFPRSTTTHAFVGGVNTFTSYGGAASPTKPSEDGDMSWANHDLTAMGLLNGSILTTLPLADYYRADCRVEYDHLADGTGYRRVIGRQVPNVPARVRLSNGLVRLNIGVAALSASWFLNPGWGSTKEWRYSVAGGINPGAVVAWPQVGVLRNTPEECSIRLVADMTNNTYHLFIADITVKRGSRWVFVRLSHFGAGVSALWTIEGAVNAAATEVKPGIHQTANDGSGNRWLLASDYANTSDLVNGKLSTAAARASLLVGLGLEKGGTGSVSPDTAVGQFAEWQGAINTVMRPVGM